MLTYLQHIKCTTSGKYLSVHCCRTKGAHLYTPTVADVGCHCCDSVSVQPLNVAAAAAGCWFDCAERCKYHHQPRSVWC